MTVALWRRVANDVPIRVAYDWRIRLIGTHVEIDGQCDKDAARVYWAFYFEDHAHDGGSPLMNFIRPE